MPITSASAMRSDNIFIAGKAVTGESFLGRSKQLTTLEIDFCREGNHRNLSILGPHMIGKSSIVNRFMERLCKQDKTIVVYKSMEGDKDASEFFYELSINLINAISKYKLHDSRSIAVRLQDADLDERCETLKKDWGKKINFQNVLARLGELSYQTYLIIDEFDNAENLFTDRSYFGQISSLCDTPRYHTTGILVSRRPLYRIEKLLANRNSTFNGKFEEFPVIGFSPDDMDDFWAVLAQYDIFPDNPSGLKQKLNYYAGAHPYLLCMYGKDLAQLSINGVTVSAHTVGDLRIRNKRAIEDYYCLVIERMKADGFYQEIVDNIINPSRSANSLEKYGYLTQLESGAFIAFCEDFTEYIKQEYTSNRQL